jgi:formate hydrogenlyase subunit 6/NADH:ubiquinone oxidoreductase subunit I
MSRRTNSKGYHPPEIVESVHCINCGLCALLCPDFAIYVEDGGMQPAGEVAPTHRIEVR